ncbi:S41 family peptidase [Miniphocaeibacter massiliensis]|uniref:S41 family peptidase n=1 Tax=Miniphocaeibacter massiliensis TaxID=2041841 RepID=UPI000C1BA9E3|nr:S41 family peptidase [Miniphocaeibacter massiliensis]
MIKKHKKLILGIIIILIAVIAGVFYFLGDNSNYKFKEIEPISELTKEDYIEDFEYAFNTLKNYYPFFEVNKEVNGIDWVGNYEKYKEKIENVNTDTEFYVAMGEILEDLNNGHTHMIPEEMGIDIAYIYSSYPRLDWRSNIFNLFKESNVQARYNITNETFGKFKEKQNKEYDTTEEENLSMGILNGDIGYIGIKSMATPNEESKKFLKDKENLEKFLIKNEKSKALIIDIRNNGGGASRYWSDFILPMVIDKEYLNPEYSFFKSGDLLNKAIFNSGAKKIDYDKLEDFPKKTLDIVKKFDKFSKWEDTVEPNENSIKFKGNIYLLVNKKVYSSSEKLATFSKESGFATLIGEQTGGDGIGSDPMVIALPKTGYLLRFPKQLGVTGKGSINEKDKTLPDYKIEDSNKKLEIKNGKVDINGDKVLEKVIDLEKK